MKQIKVAPSMLSADFTHLADEMMRINTSGADYIHIDVMDGHFVPNLTFGPVIVEGISKLASIPLDIHLMTQNTQNFIDMFLDTLSKKPEFISVHYEDVVHLNRTMSYIRQNGVRPGIVLNPHTSESCLEYILESADLVLLMSVNPGFGGQKFIYNTCKKIENLATMRERLNKKLLLEVDGGVNDKSISSLKSAGVDIAVSGSYIFCQDDYKKAVESLR